MNLLGDILFPDEEGEIVVRGPAVFSGYADDPEANRAAFRNGWFCTGDAGRLDHEGNLFITGRLKEMINRGGEKILPAEVDAALAAHPAVLEAAAFAVPHPTLGEDVACAVVLRTADEPSPSAIDLRRFAAQHLARFKVPHRIFFVDEIPRGELGKPQRWLLAERLSGSRSAPTLPAEVKASLFHDDIEDVFYLVHEIWTGILNRNDLGFDEDFFEAGGDSLSAINMLTEVDELFGSRTSNMAATFLDQPTLAQLVDLVRSAPAIHPGPKESSEIRVFPVRAGGSQRRLFCVPADGHEGLYFRRLARHLYGEMDLSIVRPANNWFENSLFTFEENGMATARHIRQAQPEGPYFVVGYCFGGIVAAEAVRHLVFQGQDARLILFDVPMPGSPSFIRNWPTWISAAKQKQPNSANGNRQHTLDFRWIAALFILLARRLVWLAAVPTRRILAPVEHLSLVRWLLSRVQGGDFPFYRANPIDAPILHFLCADEQAILLNASRLGWRTVAHSGIEERFLDFDHSNILRESNLPGIVDILRRWIGFLEPEAK